MILRQYMTVITVPIRVPSSALIAHSLVLASETGRLPPASTSAISLCHCLAPTTTTTLTTTAVWSAATEEVRWLASRKLLLLLLLRRLPRRNREEKMDCGAPEGA